MASDEEADHHLIDYFFLADDHAADLPHDLGLDMTEALDARF
jgi:hypothetical protein